MKNVKNSRFIVVLGLIFLVFFLKKENSRLHEDLIGKTEKYQQLSEHAAKLEINYVGQEELRRQLETKFAQEKGALEGRIKLLSNATFVIREAARKTGQSDFSYQGEKLKYILNEVRFANGGPPVGYVLIFDDGRVVSKLYNHKINVHTAVSRDEISGRYSIISKADYILNSPSLNLNGERNWVKVSYPLKIEGGSAFVDPTKPNFLTKKWFSWAPHINANFNILGNEVAPGLGISLSGYGLTKNDLDFRFLQLGGQYSERYKLEPSLIPVLWRPFPNTLSNTYIGPGIVQREFGISYFLGVQVGL